MTVFHLDIILYIAFLAINVYINQEKLKSDSKNSAVYFGFFSLCIFIILFSMIKEFPVAMFFFICFALMKVTRQLIYGSGK